MLFKELLLILQKKFAIREGSYIDSMMEIKDIQLLDNKIGCWREDTLYTGDWAQIKTQPEKPVLLFSTNKPGDLPSGSCWAQINSRDLFGVFNRAKDLIFKDLQFDAAFFKFAQAALHGKNISFLINAAASLMGNALILVDFSNKVLAHSTNFEIKDPLWAQNVERGYYSYEFVQKVRSSNDMKKWSKKDGETKLITLPGDKQPKLVARVTKEEHVVGAIVMIEHHTPIGKKHRQQLPLIGRILFDVCYRDYSTAEESASVHSTILFDLLDETLSTAHIQEHVEIAKIGFPKKMYAVVVRFVHYIQNRYVKHTLDLELKRIFPEGHSVHYKGYVGMLASSVSEEQKHLLAKLTQNEDAGIGISWSFTDIMEFRRHFYQAVSAIKEAQRFGQFNGVFDYTGYAIYDLFFNYMGKTSLECFCHPALKILQAYDRANNTELYKTLRTYLECEKGLRSTSEALHIHRNTLLYRINRIAQLTDLDLKNSSLSQTLMMSFYIEAFLMERY